jgi:heterodisulfide reductase subunit A
MLVTPRFKWNLGADLGKNTRQQSTSRNPNSGVALTAIPKSEIQYSEFRNQNSEFKKWSCNMAKAVKGRKTAKKDASGAVMVLGGGIAGVQTALDLTDLGYYVYLVEKNPAIGGVMAQLDKTFPTNDCAL